MPGARRTFRSVARDESGFTVFEVMVAALLLAVGLMATFQAFSSATRNTHRLKQTQVLLDRAQLEMEKIRAKPYSEIALTVLPAHSTDSASPGARVVGGRFALTTDPVNPRYSDLVYNGSALYGGGSISTGSILPESGTITSGDVKLRVYRYVVWRRDPNCPNTAALGQPSCPGNQDYKRVVVAVRLVGPGAQFSSRPYIEVQSDFIDPAKSAVTDPPAGPQGVVTAQQWWLSDTPCAAVGETVRADVNADHGLHNTLGQCANGLQTGTTPGAPDALLTAAPPDPFLDDPTLPGIFDFSNDFYLEPNPPSGDRGVQIRRQDASGCSWSPTGANPESKIHRWVTDPLPAAFTATGQATLEFYTAAINNALHSGRLCVYLFTRNAGGNDAFIKDSGTPPGTNQFFTYQPPSGESWPRATPTASDPLGWKKIRFEMNFPQFTITAGQRLGLAVSTERSGTTFDAGLQMLYDHHLTPSRIEVETTTPLDMVDSPTFTIDNPTVTTLPATLTGSLSKFASGQTIEYRLDNPATGTVLAATTTPSPTTPSGNASVTLTLPATVANGAHTIYALGSDGDFAGRQITVNASRVLETALLKTSGCSADYLKKGGTYYIYANVGGTPATVTANVSGITAGQTAVPLSSGTYTVGGRSYNYRNSVALTAGSTLPESSISYTVTPSGGSVMTDSVVIDNTAPTPIDVQTLNRAGGTVGLPETGDAVVFTYSETVEPCSIVPGWDGEDPVGVAVLIEDNGGTSNDRLRIYNGATQAPLGTINLGPIRGDYTGNKDAVFGSSGTASGLDVNTYQFIVTLGSLSSGSVKLGGFADVMTWTPMATAFDRAGNASATNVISESGVSDKEF